MVTMTMWHHHPPPHEDEVGGSAFAVACSDPTKLHRCAMCREFGGDGLPPILTRDSEYPLQAVCFALPRFQGETPHRHGKLDLKHWSCPGVACVRGHHDQNKMVWFCDCTTANVCVRRMVEGLHMVEDGCSDVVDANCLCVQYVKAILKDTGCSVEEIIDGSPIHDGTGDS
jgi:hypothetical protein